MKSIRLSLLVYFLGLLAVALGLVSVFVYRTTQETLADKNRATAELIRRQYDDLCAQERARLDKALLSDARALASRVQIQPDNKLLQLVFEDWKRRGARAAVAGFNPGNPLSAAMWAQGGLNVLAALSRRPAAEIKLGESDPDGDDPADDSHSVVDYLQIQTGFPYNASYHSRPLDGLSLSPPAEKDWGREYQGPEYSDVELGPGVTVRRVLFRTSLHVAPRPGAAPGDGRDGRPGGPRGGPFQPWGTVLAAYAPARLEAAYAPFRGQRDADLDDLERRADESLTGLRNRLLAISFATFAAVVLGVYFLVRLGLLPLQRLSDALSKVSEKDFRLPFDEPRLPAELAPIVDHLKQTLGQLRGAFEREKQAAADISHELRTPVAALLTTIDVALKKPRKPEEYREVLADCRESGQQICQLVERLLTLARLDAGVDHLRVESVDVAALAEQCTALVRPLAEARGLTLRLHRAGEAVLSADPAKLREVLTNLLHNAIEYNRPEGSVDLSVVRHNGTLRVEVRDTGVGIPPEARARIFERFYRADPSRAAEGLHAGLGLAIVKGYVDLMGGSVAVESTEGEGSTFRVELPAA